MSESNDISIIIPMYNASSFIEASLNSLLAQSHQPHEILVIDDASTDSSVSRVEAYRSHGVRCLKQEKLGPWAARNLGIQSSESPYLAFHDADDLAHPDKLKKQLEAVIASNNTHILFTAMTPFSNEASEEVFSIRNNAIQDGICPGTMLLHRSIINTVGLFKTDNDLGSFLDWIARAEDHGYTKACLSEALLARRVHSENQTGVAIDTLGKSYLKELRSIVKRRKGS